MKYEVKFTNQFKKDIKLAKKQNKDLNKLFDVLLNDAFKWQREKETCSFTK